MVAIKALSILAVAGSVIAAPANVGSALEVRAAEGYSYNYHWSDSSSSSDSDETPSETEGGRKPHVVVENKNVVVTEYVTRPWGSRPRPTQPAASSPAAVEPSVPVVTATEPAQPVVTDRPWEDVSSAPAETASPTSEAPAPSGTGYMAIVNEYRAKMGLSELTQDSKLESNAMDTSNSAMGTLTHKLNPGSMGQVMAPGDDNIEEFEHVFVGGWLCEIPSLLPSDCGEQSKGWNYEGQTGHAKILTDTKYSKIGCACATGIWTCDVA